MSVTNLAQPTGFRARSQSQQFQERFEGDPANILVQIICQGPNESIIPRVCLYAKDSGSGQAYILT